MDTDMRLMTYDLWLMTLSVDASFVLDLVDSERAGTAHNLLVHHKAQGHWGRVVSAGVADPRFVLSGARF